MSRSRHSDHPVDPLDAVDRAVALLAADDDRLVREIARWVDDERHRALLHLVGAENARGHDGWRELALKHRDRLLRALGATVSAKELVAELHTFATRVWPRTRALAASPDPPGSRRWMLWNVLRLSDHVLSVRAVARILAATE